MGLYRVRVDDGQTVQVRKWFIPELLENTLTGAQIAMSGGSGSTWDQVLGYYNTGVGQTAFTINNFSPASVIFVRHDYATVNSCYMNALAPAGFGNVITLSSSLVGNKWIFDNDNYIEVTGYYNQNNTEWITVNYCLASGIVAVRDVSLEASYANGSWDRPWQTYQHVSPILWHTNNPNSYIIVKWVIQGDLYNPLQLYASHPGGTIESQELARQFFEGIEPMDPNNPYGPGGYSDETDEPEGNFSDESDDVTTDAMPDEDYASAVGSGFSTIFLPTKTQLKRLGETFWGQTIVGFFQNMIENISDCFVSLGILPFVLAPGSTVEVTWFNLAITGIYLNLAPKQFYEYDMGSINLGDDSRIFTSGSALDYSPYSRLGIYLPFIGYQELDIDECRGAVLNLKYRIDILSGACVAIISIGSKAVYQFAGNCLTQIPITSQDMSGLLTGLVTVATAGVGLGMNAAVASAGGEVTAELASAKKISEASATLDATQRTARVANSAGNLVSATANSAMGMKPTYNKTGAISAANSLLAVKQPYLFLITPRQSLPERYQKYCGFPSNITGKLNTFSGYTVVEDIRLNGLVATSTEVEEIYELLKSGVII